MNNILHVALIPVLAASGGTDKTQNGQHKHYSFTNFFVCTPLSPLMHI
jgi:hypothetical protein